MQSKGAHVTPEKKRDVRNGLEEIQMGLDVINCLKSTNNESKQREQYKKKKEPVSGPEHAPKEHLFGNPRSNTVEIKIIQTVKLSLTSNNENVGFVQQRAL